MTEPHNSIVRGTYASTDKAESVLRLLVEGNSIRSIERITGMHRDSVMRLLSIVGERCENWLEDRIRKVSVSDVQCDEMWGFVGCKEKAKTEDHPITFGDAYCFVAIERKTKLVLAWHLGRRNARDTVAFTEKIDAATTGRFQITTDGFQAYEEAIHYSLGTRVDFAQLIKMYGSPVDGEHRYSPPEVVNAISVPRLGKPAPQRISTSHVERQNLTMRMCIRRLTRLTNAFSKKWVNLKAALAMYFAYYNFCRVHMTLRVTPAMEHGLTDHVWSIKELINACV
ncbi:MAG TPA: IS1 family transposase [Candidatus Dormibacteraeota bacterium]|nr:IS1 family transposase [Candidatus Dormibacteraeota bacterium]